MGRWWTPRRMRIAWGGVLLVAVVVFILLRDLDEIVKWASILGFFVALVSLLLSLTSRELRDSGPGQVQRLNHATEDLAAAVQQQWRAEERLRRIQDPFPLPVRWTAACPGLTDYWANLGQPVAKGNLGGRLEQITDVFCRVPSGRLVVLGKPGAGKTVLTLRFTLDLLARRQPQDRVPVIFPMASWLPGRQSLHAWMAERLGTDYPALGALAPSGSSWAWELVRAGRILPVLDGLDELSASLRGEAMRHLNLAFEHDAPVLLTCRAEEYRNTVQVAGVFVGAAVVELLPLTLQDLAEYLPRTVHHSRNDESDSPMRKWESVLACLQENTGKPAGQVVLEVLSTPLMTSMARVAYSDTNADPTDLLDDRFADPATLEQHLLDAFIPAAYSHPRPAAAMSTAAQVRYHPDQARQWLEFLARHLHQLRTRDIAWWQQAQAIPRRTYGLLAGLICGLAFGLVGELAAGPAMGVAYGMAFGFAAGLTNGLGHQPQPSQLEIRFRGTGAPFLRRFAIGLVTGLVFGIGFELPPIGMLGLALAFGFAVGLHVWLDIPIDAARVSSPPTVLKQDRTVALAFGLSFALPFSLAYGTAIVVTDTHPGGVALSFGLFLGPEFVLAGAVGGQFVLAGAVAGAVAGSLAYGRIGTLPYGLAGAVMGALVIPSREAIYGLGIGLVCGLAIGLVTMLSRAWGSFMLGQTWLAVRGHQPWRLMRFLEDAHQRGVLRQTGGVYQFRHARLQDHLAEPD